jgi:Fe-S cluster assembly ATPase SufC
MTLKESAKTGICIAERMQNPANYRGITVRKIFTKIIQSIGMVRVRRKGMVRVRRKGYGYG